LKICGACQEKDVDMTIPQIIHFTIPQHPTDVQLRNIQIARDLHPGWEVVVWQDPVDRTLFTLGKYWDKVNSGAQLADLIRLEVVYKQGGFYVDSDFVLLKNLDPLRQHSFVVGTEDGYLLTNAFFGAVPQSPVLGQLIAALDEHEVDWKLPPDVTTGPKFFLRELKWHDDVTVLPRETFYPYFPSTRPLPPRKWTYGSHLWVSSWKMDVHRRRPVRSLIFHTRRIGRQIINQSRTRLLRLRYRMRLHHPVPFSASGVICAQTIHGPRIYLVGEDASLTPEIAQHGTYEFYEEVFAKRVVRPGDWAIDVGANVGAFSLVFANSVGPSGRVFSYEPNPLPASLLKKSLVTNWFHDRVSVREMALSSEVGTFTLRFNRERLGDATLAAKENTGTFEKTVALLGSSNEVEVPVRTLDLEFPVDLPIRILKIDAEGFDHHVLRGAARLLERNSIDILMLECLQEVYGSGWHEFMVELKKIIGFGYQPHVLTKKSKLTPITFNDILYSTRERNIVFVSPDARHTIRELA
jgi:FkbM family methyltransferase